MKQVMWAPDRRWRGEMTFKGHATRKLTFSFSVESWNSLEEWEMEWEMSRIVAYFKFNVCMLFKFIYFSCCLCTWMGAEFRQVLWRSKVRWAPGEHAERVVCLCAVMGLVNQLADRSEWRKQVRWDPRWVTGERAEKRTLMLCLQHGYTCYGSGQNWPAWHKC